MSEKSKKAAVAAAKPMALSPTDMLALFGGPQKALEGVEIQFPVIQINGSIFELPDGSKAESFEGVILDQFRLRAYWVDDFDQTGGGDVPDCFSMDCVSPVISGENVQAETCAQCPHAVYGTGKNGAGTACKIKKRIHIMMPGQSVPHRLSIPYMSIKPLDFYIQTLVSRGLPYQLVRTRFSLIPAKSSAGIAYSKVALMAGETISDMEQAGAIRATLDEWYPKMRAASETTE